ncbi:MAG TPA: winged helix-turn-helix domain-containing protein [Solirubrobacterales bacterium]|nr:winged helix-turn-helix domain-containing protein [Solirubrobacterales bacterium]
MSESRDRTNGEGFNGKLRQVIDPAVAKALSHPLRSHILITLGDRIASPNEIAKELGLAARDLDYHVKVLVEVGMIRLASAEKRRGVNEHFYELSARIVYFDDQEWKRVPAPVRATFSAALLQALMDEAGAALREGTFNARHDTHASRTSMLLDEQGWHELTRAMDEALERLLAIRSQSAKRLKSGTGRGIPTAVFMLGFETAAGAGRGRGAAVDA